MKIKKRKGSLALTVSVFFLVTMVIATSLIFSFNKMMLTKKRVEKTTDMVSYFTVSNILANGFKNDLELKICKKNGGDVTNKSKIEIYNEIMEVIQNRMIEKKESDYQYREVNPVKIINKLTISDDMTLGIKTKTKDDIVEMLENVEMKIILNDGEVNKDMVVVKDGSDYKIDDFFISVILSKGLTEYTQVYKISGIKLNIEDPYTSTPTVSFDDSNSTLTPVSQNITKITMEQEVVNK